MASRTAALLAALAVAGLARAEAPVPALTGPVVDRAGLLSRAEASRLEELARGGRAANGGAGPQLQFLVVPSLDGEDIESYAMRVAEAWRLGTADRDDGVLVVVAVEDRAVRIEVGGGIEGGLTDVQSSRIIRGTITPAFRQRRFGEGLYDAGTQILGALGALPSGVAPRRPAGREPVRLPLVAILGFIVLSSVLRGFLGFGRRRRRSLWWGGGPFIGGGFGRGGFGGGGGGWSGGGGGFSGGGASGRW